MSREPNGKVYFRIGRLHFCPARCFQVSSVVSAACFYPNATTGDATNGCESSSPWHDSVFLFFFSYKLLLSKEEALAPDYFRKVRPMWNTCCPSWKLRQSGANCQESVADINLFTSVLIGAALSARPQKRSYDMAIDAPPRTPRPRFRFSTTHAVGERDRIATPA